MLWLGSLPLSGKGVVLRELSVTTSPRQAVAPQTEACCWHWTAVLSDLTINSPSLQLGPKSCFPHPPDLYLETQG